MTHGRATERILHILIGCRARLGGIAVSRACQSGIVRSAAGRAFARIGAPAVPLLLDMLAPEVDEKTQEWVAEALLLIGSPALAAVPSLRARLESGNRGLRIRTAL